MNKEYTLYSCEAYCFESEIKNGCTQAKFEPCTEQESFETKEEALKALKHYSSYVDRNRTELEKVEVTEYFVEEFEVDEDGEYISCETIAYADGLN